MVADTVTVSVYAVQPIWSAITISIVGAVLLYLHRVEEVAGAVSGENWIKTYLRGSLPSGYRVYP
mgnify:CR=1 FL=1